MQVSSEIAMLTEISGSVATVNCSGRLVYLPAGNAYPYPGKEEFSNGRQIRVGHLFTHQAHTGQWFQYFEALS